MILVFRNLLIPEWKRLQREEQKRVWLAASKSLRAERTTKPLLAMIAIVPFLVLAVTSSPRAFTVSMLVVVLAVGAILEARVAKHARAILNSSERGVSR